MDTDKLATFIVEPNLVGRNNLKDLKAIKEQYPFCSSLHLLYIKALANAKDIHFEEALKTASIHANNRERLYQLIHEHNSLNETITVKKVDKELEETESIKETTIQDPITADAKSLKEESSKLVEEITEVDSNIVEQETEATSEPPILAEKVAEVTEDIVPQDLTLADEIDERNLTENIISSALENAVLFDVENIEKPSEEIPLEKGNISIETGIELNFEPNNEEITLELEKKSKEKNILTESSVSNLSFSDWLKMKKNHQEIAVDKPIKKEIEKETKLTKKEINNLLNKFIDEEPKMARIKKEFYNPVKNAKESLDESDVLVSETLAKIYYMQKNYSKAIKAYAQLSLLYPKKKSFFANQIEKIRKEELK
ncbi:hypothetical protein DNU06_00380 [Putridiphycobacter roseus]|uniref:Tetratricopeptide repeat protein n=1 Tax=Putridiphycobacter roseus TaxID=2219161 RepID=A0A2W1NK76_9FLAO|nr:hypothetical protein [Putridiphycobacter roseus]PZE18326.1 hypothetical protein DNU06_00380 [Putridiphycobacter roseus]